MGNSLLHYRMGFCDVENYYKKSFKWCTDNNHKWKIYDFNFDNVLNSLLTLFIISNLEGWIDILNHAIDSNYDSIVILFIFLFYFYLYFYLFYLFLFIFIYFYLFLFIFIYFYLFYLFYF